MYFKCLYFSHSSILDLIGGHAITQLLQASPDPCTPLPVHLWLLSRQPPSPLSRLPQKRTIVITKCLMFIHKYTRKTRSMVRPLGGSALRLCREITWRFAAMHIGHVTIILGAIDIDISSWKSSLHAYGMRTWLWRNNRQISLMNKLPPTQVDFIWIRVDDHSLVREIYAVEFV